MYIPAINTPQTGFSTPTNGSQQEILDQLNTLGNLYKLVAQDPAARYVPQIMESIQSAETQIKALIKNLPPSMQTKASGDLENLSNIFKATFNCDDPTSLQSLENSYSATESEFKADVANS